MAMPRLRSRPWELSSHRRLHQVALTLRHFNKDCWSGAIRQNSTDSPRLQSSLVTLSAPSCPHIAQRSPAILNLPTNGATLWNGVRKLTTTRCRRWRTDTKYMPVHFLLFQRARRSEFRIRSANDETVAASSSWWAIAGTTESKWSRVYWRNRRFLRIDCTTPPEEPDPPAADDISAGPSDVLSQETAIAPSPIPVGSTERRCRKRAQF